MAPPSGEDREGSADTVYVDALSFAKESQAVKEDNGCVSYERSSRSVKKKPYCGYNTKGMAAQMSGE
jgi:hypothetical protein